MDNRNSEKKIQNWIFLSASLLGLAAFFLILNLFLPSLELNLALVLYFGLFPLFLVKPETFIPFLFLVTPSLRIVAANETIIYNWNFNAIINFSIIFFGLIFIFKKRSELKKTFKENNYLFFFLGLVLLSYLSFFYSSDKNETSGELVRISGVFILAVWALLSVQSRKFFNLAVFSMIAGAILPSLAGLYQFFRQEGWWDKTIGLFRIQGTFLHPATFSFYLLLLIPIILALAANLKNRFVKVLLASLSAFFLFFVIASLTRGAWIGLFAMIGAYGIFKSRKVLIISAGLLFLVYLAVPSIRDRVNDVINPKYNSSFSVRKKIVQTTFPAFYRAPLTGYGFGSFGYIHNRYNDEAHTYESLQAHNDYLRILIELGAIGLGLLLSIYLLLYKNIRKRLALISNQDTKNYLLSLIIIWAGALAISFGDNVLRTMEVQYLLWAYTGSVLAISSLKLSSIKHTSV